MTHTTLTHGSDDCFLCDDLYHIVRCSVWHVWEMNFNGRLWISCSTTVSLLLHVGPKRTHFRLTVEHILISLFFLSEWLSPHPVCGPSNLFKVSTFKMSIIIHHTLFSTRWTVFEWTSFTWFIIVIKRMVGIIAEWVVKWSSRRVCASILHRQAGVDLNYEHHMCHTSHTM